ncbi:hypothetical protein CsSME_00046750 [Camellia sinensis var. sinensis]
MEDLPEDSSHTCQQSSLSNHDDLRFYFVPYRWWKEAHDSSSWLDSDGKRGILYTASSASLFAGPMKIISNIFNSDLVLNLRREDDSVHNKENGGEVGISGRDYALVTGEMWLQALKWHIDSKIAMKNGRSFSAAEDDMADVYPLQLRRFVLRETNSVGVKISKKDNAAEHFRRACKIFSAETELDNFPWKWMPSNSCCYAVAHMGFFWADNPIFLKRKKYVCKRDSAAVRAGGRW